MNIQRKQIINQLLKSWPKGTVAVSLWLRSQGVSRQLAKVYQKSSWITPIGQGAFIRLDDKVDWAGGVYALQGQLNLPVHVGGRTALYLQGIVHFVPMGKDHPVFLFGNERFLPLWFREHHWNQPVKYIYTNSFSYKKNAFTNKEMGAYAITLASRELAILEVLYLVDKEESFENAVRLMEGLNTLRPALVQELLEQCSSIKVKRLFMHLAEHFNHPWVKHLKVAKLDFGKGKRVIAQGGQFNNKYQISVPKID